MRKGGPILVTAGIIVGGLGVMQSLLIGVGVAHLGIILGVLGLALLAVGAWMTFANGNSAKAKS